MVAPPGLARVAGMLVLEPYRLDEADRVELAVLGRGLREREALGLVAQVRPPRRARRVVRVVVERLVVELEHLARAVRPHRIRERLRIRADSRHTSVRPSRPTHVTVGVRPAAGVPRPSHTGRAQLVADRGPRLWWELRRV